MFCAFLVAYLQFVLVYSGVKGVHDKHVLFNYNVPCVKIISPASRKSDHRINTSITVNINWNSMTRPMHRRIIDARVKREYYFNSTD